MDNRQFIAPPEAESDDTPSEPLVFHRCAITGAMLGGLSGAVAGLQIAAHLPNPNGNAFPAFFALMLGMIGAITGALFELALFDGTGDECKFKEPSETSPRS